MYWILCGLMEYLILDFEGHSITYIVMISIFVYGRFFTVLVKCGNTLGFHFDWLFHGCVFYSVFTFFSLLLFLHLMLKWGLGAPICDINYNITINQHMGPYPMSGPECKCRWGSSKIALNLHLIAWPPYYIIPLSCGITLYNTSIYYYYNTVILK